MQAAEVPIIFLAHKCRACLRLQGLRGWRTKEEEEEEARGCDWLTGLDLAGWLAATRAGLFEVARCTTFIDAQLMRRLTLPNLSPAWMDRIAVLIYTRHFFLPTS